MVGCRLVRCSHRFLAQFPMRRHPDVGTVDLDAVGLVTLPQK